jgi:exosortase
MIPLAQSILKVEGWFSERIRTPRARGCLSILFTLFIYHSVVLQLFHSWLKNDYYSHGFLIPLISGYLVYKDRGRLSRLAVKPSLHGIPLAAAGVVIFILDRYVWDVLFLSSISMLIFMTGGVLLVLGKKHLKVLLFPILFLLFMIPIPDPILDIVIGPLQLLASMIGGIILRVLGVPVLREGIYLHLAPFAVKVDKTCSSMHSVIALSALSLIIGYIMMNSIPKRCIIVASSVPLAILANGCRLVLIIILALWRGQGIFESFFHPLSGKLFFIIALSILVMEAAVLNRISRPLGRLLPRG